MDFSASTSPLRIPFNSPASMIHFPAIASMNRFVSASSGRSSANHSSHRKGGESGGLVLSLQAFEDEHLVKLDARLHDPANARDEHESTDGADILGVFRLAIGDKPTVDARRAVPCKRIEVVPNRVEAVVEREVCQEVRPILARDAELILRAGQEPEPGARLVVKVRAEPRQSVDEEPIGELVIADTNPFPLEEDAGVMLGREFLPVVLLELAPSLSTSAVARQSGASHTARPLGPFRERSRSP